MKIVVLDGYALNPGDLTWKGIESLGECVILIAPGLKTFLSEFVLPL